MDPIYTTSEARRRFSELLRQVRAGRRVVISYRGEPVAELRPIDTQEAALERAVRDGILSPPNPGPRLALKPLAHRPGALQRFLDSRD